MVSEDSSHACGILLDGGVEILLHIGLDTVDMDGDGLGDIRGVTEKLDYLQELGVDYLWMTPFFQSPLNDNGYDISDYYAIDPVFGSMADVEELIAQAGQRGIGLMFDMVFNHTSTQHQWFQRALAGDEEYQRYYIFRDGSPDAPPTNWESKFGGSAWEYVPHLKKWYLHLFDKTQADLNWDDSRVREELKNVLRFWKGKGVKGFRFDVVNLISKPALFQDDDRGDGRRFYTDGPHVHEYLKELVADAGIGDMITVGEMSSTSLGDCIRYTDPAEQELSMTFSFHHLKVDYKDGDKWELQSPDLAKLKELLTTWQLEMQAAGGWNAVFWCNHDQPRAVSRFGDDGRYWKESAKMLATCIHLLRGTPYIFQGEELGMTNAGFTSGTPWIAPPDSFKTINVETELRDEGSILRYYKELIRLRKEHPAISDGQIQFLDCGKGVLTYRRSLGGDTLLVFNNLTDKEVALADAPWTGGCRKVLGNYADTAVKAGHLVLRPYESIVYQP